MGVKVNVVFRQDEVKDEYATAYSGWDWSWSWSFADIDLIAQSSQAKVAATKLVLRYLITEYESYTWGCCSQLVDWIHASFVSNHGIAE